jgi:hypothetical protein
MEHSIILTLTPSCNAAWRHETGVQEVGFDHAIAKMRCLMNAYIEQQPDKPHPVASSE